MKRKPLVVLSILVVAGIVAGLIINSSNYQRSKPSKRNTIHADKVKNIACPLPQKDCLISEVELKKAQQDEFSQLGFYSVASGSSIFAVFGGTVMVEDLKINKEKHVYIKNSEYNLTAVYHFTGDVRDGLMSREIKPGEIIGVTNPNLSLFEKKYSFVFTIFDDSGGNYRKFKFMESREGVKLLEL